MLRQFAAALCQREETSITRLPGSDRLLASLALTPWLEGLLFGVSVTDPLTFGSISSLLIIVALLACWIPARRATKIDPLQSIRSE
ncbi:MAG: hypothetical protein J2P21_29580 [Chloracidobacterium sp.]|nr:hypothetical protein [Chloracidobacterium sp.]